MSSNYWIAMQKQEYYKNQWLKVNSELTEDSGIYIMTRIDENGFKFAYVGQAKKILTRLAEHKAGYTQHIDKSLRKHGLYNLIKNPYGWYVRQHKCSIEELDELERKYIKEYADMGYQLRNKTIGGQDNKKSGLNENKESKGYRDGLKQGSKNAYKEILEYFEKYLDFVIKSTPTVYKKDGSIKEIYLKKYQEFKEKLENANN